MWYPKRLAMPEAVNRISQTEGALLVQDERMRLAMLIGAGASYGCGYTDPSSRPPLGTHLFPQLVDAYPETWGTLLDSDLPPLFRDNFEDGMAETWRRLPVRFSHLLIDMARFFSRFEPPKDDLYSTVVRELHASKLLRRTAVASLNYECVFEVAVSLLGLRLSMNLDAPPAGQVLLFKPHGSCNFLPDTQAFGFTVALGSPEGVLCEAEVAVKNLPEVRALYDADFAFPPCMSLYAEGKATLVCQSFIDDARSGWATWVRRCDYVISVGTRPNLADAHVWDPIVESKAIVWFVGGKDAGVAELEGAIGTRFRHVAETFEEAAPILCRRLRLLA